ncbi:hypothetical protein [Paraburkholderia sacchari]|nr:hypothetical protein [Paraburkholderia sacchari]
MTRPRGVCRVRPFDGQTFAERLLQHTHDQYAPLGNGFSAVCATRFA